MTGRHDGPSRRPSGRAVCLRTRHDGPSWRAVMTARVSQALAETHVVRTSITVMSQICHMYSSHVLQCI